MELTRRDAVRAGLGAVSAALLGGCATGFPLGGSPAGVVATDGALTTSHWPGGSPRWALWRPDPAQVPAPRLVVALHGKGGTVGDTAYLGLPGAMVIDDLLPVLRAQEVSPKPVGLLGWSMGGYGALWLAIRHGAAVVGAVGGMSSALWTSPGASAPGAFDNREDFLAHDVFARASALAGMPVRLDCGTSDPFIAANRAFATLVPQAVVTFDAGGHDDGYWRPHGIRQLEWFAQTLPA